MKRKITWWEGVGLIAALIASVGTLVGAKAYRDRKPPVETGSGSLVEVKEGKPPLSESGEVQPPDPADSGDAPAAALPAQQLLDSSSKIVAGSWHYDPDTVSIAGKLYDGRGRVVGAADFATFDVRGWERFTAVVGVDDNAPSDFSFDMAIEVDGRPVWRVVDQKKGVPGANVDILLKARESLTFRIQQVRPAYGRSGPVIGKPRLTKGSVGSGLPDVHSAAE